MSSLSSELRRRANKEFNKTIIIIIMIIITTNAGYVRFVIPIKSSLRPQKHIEKKKKTTIINSMEQ